MYRIRKGEPLLIDVDDEALLQTLARSLREVREQRGMTQAQVSDAIGIDQELYDRIERGQELPSLQVLYGLAIVLETSVTGILDQRLPDGSAIDGSSTTDGSPTTDRPESVGGSPAGISAAESAGDGPGRPEILMDPPRWLVVTEFEDPYFDERQEVLTRISHQPIDVKRLLGRLIELCEGRRGRKKRRDD